MGFAFRVEDDNFVPVITCDTCHDVIDDWEMAVVTHELTVDKPLLPARVVHKGPCDRGSRQWEGHQPNAAWQELYTFLPAVLWNNGWGEKGGDPEGDATVMVDVPEFM